MSTKKNLKIALLGNPNSGKSSLFNHLTGLNQKVGNFPGVTVDKKIGKARISDTIQADIIDLPGVYSLYPRSVDEQVVYDYLNDRASEDFPDLLLVVADASNLKRNLFLYSQLYDLGIPLILVLTMTDIAQEHGLKLETSVLQHILKVPVVLMNTRTGKNLFRLRELIAAGTVHPGGYTFPVDELAPELIAEIRTTLNLDNAAQALHLAHRHEQIAGLTEDQREQIRAIVKKYRFDSRALQVSETMNRYAFVDSVVAQVQSGQGKPAFSEKLDRILTHGVWGYLIFFLILFVVFQAIFSWASLPMDYIDQGFGALASLAEEHLPEGPLTSLLTEGIIAGLGGILIFIPQIAILFAFIALLEESGYMARVMFIMDKFMRKFGMNGRSVVPLISGVACAVPAIMAARSIDNVKERLITIFVTPFMSCSARIPVYTVLIALVIPPVSYGGVISLQGLVLMFLYLAGFGMAVLTGVIMNKMMKVGGPKSFFILEFPTYKMPRWKNVLLTILEKVKSFTFEAGKVIMAISVVLWVLATYGPADKIESGKENAVFKAQMQNLSAEDTEHLVSSAALENSYAGHLGKFIEPVIRPLGFDWKIGIALITSFAAREVFVGTMATIYSIGDEAEETSVMERMRKELHPVTGEPFYNLPMGLSLLVFYAFAMQCMSTLAIVYRETKGFKWPLIQFFTMSGVAYLCSLIVFNIFS